MISLETDIQVLSNTFDFFSKIVSQEINLSNLAKKDQDSEIGLDVEITEPPNLLPIVFKISKYTMPE